MEEAPVLRRARPNSPLRPAVTALAPAPESKPAVETAADDPQQAIQRSPARDLRAMLLARIYEAFPLTCPICGAEMWIIAFIMESIDVRAILEHIGEPATPPRIGPGEGAASAPFSYPYPGRYPAGA